MKQYPTIKSKKKNKNLLGSDSRETMCVYSRGCQLSTLISNLTQLNFFFFKKKRKTHITLKKMGASLSKTTLIIGYNGENLSINIFFGIFLSLYIL